MDHIDRDAADAARPWGCDWLRRGCHRPAGHDVWHRGPQGDDVRHVCDVHLPAAAALGYRVGTPPPRPDPDRARAG